MGKLGKNALALGLALVALGGCGPMGSNISLIDAKVVKLGKTHLIMDDGKSVMFVTVEAPDKQHLKKLKKGDKITLVTKKEEGDDHAVDVVEIITLDGTHIPLGE